MATVKGTWRFNDTLPLTDNVQQNVNFSISTISHDVKYLMHCTEIGFGEGILGNASMKYFVTESDPLDYFDSNFIFLPTDIQVYSVEWNSYWGEGVKTITFTSEQEVTDEFYAWFTANATQIDEEETPIATITYKGEILETLNGGEYVTLHTKGKALEDDIRVEVADIPTPEDNYLPAEITTETQMDALPIGAVFRYVGETTDKYENGTLYLVEESE